MQCNPPDDLPLRVRTMQIIDAALVMGLLSFLLIVTVILPGKPVALGVLPLLTLIALGFAAAMIVVRVIVVNIVTIAGRRRIGPPDATGRPTAGARDGTTEQLLALYQTRMIVGAACLKGPRFFFDHVYDRAFALVAGRGDRLDSRHCRAFSHAARTSPISCNSRFHRWKKRNTRCLP